MDNSPLKYLKMDAEKRLNKIQELSSMIVTLKKNTTVDSKKTIQKLQQQIDELIYD